MEHSLRLQLCLERNVSMGESSHSLRAPVSVTQHISTPPRTLIPHTPPGLKGRASWSEGQNCSIVQSIYLYLLKIKSTQICSGVFNLTHLWPETDWWKISHRTPPHFSSSQHQFANTRHLLSAVPMGWAISISFVAGQLYHWWSSPPLSALQMDPSALWPGHLWGQTGKCSRRSSWPEPPVHRHCSIRMSHGRTCWTSEQEQIAHTYLSSLCPCSYLYVVRCKYKWFKITLYFKHLAT